ncbi:hypothetical protein HID58_078752 [Brassica napus]|uniref:Morc S5 domain-containing protein n=1 Tax=Brassica napus TaxID=3708 RepID=A0ABQ7YUY1_BRANA|nr:hypothetical protein HID58_078752 [Brassica napus]
MHKGNCLSFVHCESVTELYVTAFAFVFVLRNKTGPLLSRSTRFDIVKDNSPALAFQDDGARMDPYGIRKCMSLGYSSKKSNTTIGQRKYFYILLKETLRFFLVSLLCFYLLCSSKATQSVGLLSYTFLRKTGQEDVTVPMVKPSASMGGPQPIVYESSEDWSTNLNILLKWSQFEDIGAHGSKVIIYNLWLNDEGIFGLSFDDDDEVLNISLKGQAFSKGLHFNAISQNVLKFQDYSSGNPCGALKLKLDSSKRRLNFQLAVSVYMCEEYTKKETEMEQTVRNLEKELEEAKSKCAQLALLVDAKRKEMQQV